MARIRSIKPTFWSDEKIGLLPRDVRLTFLGLISALADDHGRLVGNARIVKGTIYPYDDDITVADVEAHLTLLVGAGRILRYRVAESDYIAIVNWRRHQRVDKPSPSLLPPPPESFDDGSANVRRALPTERSGAEGKGAEEEREGKRSGGPVLDSRPAVADPGESPVSVDLAPLLATLPPQAMAFLARFYEPAFSPNQRDRYRDVALQLVDALDPKRVGPKVRGGQRVKARSAEHLDDTCRAVMADPPRDRDMAIVLVLKKLLDPPKGPSVTEVAKREESAARAVEDRYHAAAKRAATQWAHEHPDDYRPIREAIERAYAGKSGAFAVAAMESELTQRCAQLAGFPSFDEWRRQQPIRRTAPSSPTPAGAPA